MEEWESIQALNSIWVSSGDLIQIRRGGSHLSNGSIGYSASLGSLRGFITTAHFAGGLRVGDTVHNASGQLIGRVSNGSHVRLTTIDAAFITLQPNVIMVSQSGGIGGSIMPGNQTTVRLGMPVASWGASSGHRFGEVTRPVTSTTLPTAGFLPNVVEASYRRQGGDSGGIVYTWTQDTFIAISLGHHVGGVSSGGSNFGHIAWFVRIDETNRHLGTWATWPDV